jgi:type I restriction enzyme S subunit
MSFPAYESYKESGVEWLGQVPSHWVLLALKRFVQLKSGNGITSESIKDDGPYPVMGGNGLRGYAEDFTHDGDFVLIGRQGALCGNIQYGQGKFWASEHAIVALPLRPVATFWLGELLRSMNLNQYSVSAAQPGLSVEALSELVCPMPPLPEQHAIAAFLDRETAKIDALVEAQRRLIDLLKEKRQAVISHAVTKGLDPSAPMKDSGVEWLGDVPAHWEISQSRRMFGVRSEPALPGDQMLTASQKYGVIFQADFVEREGRRVVEVIMGKDSLRHVEPDDFVISMRSFQGGLEWSQLRGSTSFHYVMVTPIKWVHPPFFACLFKSLPYIQALRATTDLIRDGQEIRYSHFVKVPLPVIPLEEQKQIASFLSVEVGRYDGLLEKSEEFIQLLQERRAALISAAVTGKIDVRGLVKTAEAA